MNGSLQQSLVNREVRLPEQEWRGRRGELRAIEAIEAIEVTPLEDREGQIQKPGFPMPQIQNPCHIPAPNSWRETSLCPLRPCLDA